MIRRGIRRSSVVVVALTLPGELACVLVDNPDYVGVASDTGTETTTSETSGASTSETSTSTTDTSTTTDTSSTSETTDGWCPPGQAGELGCPCNDVDLPCDPGFNCTNGVCTEPSNCPAEDPSVLVAIDPIDNQPSADPYSGNCQLVTSIDPQGMISGMLSGCLVGDVSKTDFSLGPLVLPPDDPLGLIGNKAAAVELWVLSPEQRFMRVGTNTFTIWLAIGPAFDSGDPTLSDYPVAFTPSNTDCPALPEPCGASQRRALQVADAIVFDGATADLGAGTQVWVDEAKSICGVDSYRVALLAPSL